MLDAGEGCKAITQSAGPQENAAKIARFVTFGLPTPIPAHSSFDDSQFAQ